MDYGFTQRTELRPVPKIVPEQIFAGRILQMPAMELETFLCVEFQENPALLLEDAEPEEIAAEEPAEEWDPGSSEPFEEDYDPFRTVAEAPSLIEDLVTQFRTQFPTESWTVGLAIIESLDDDGYLRENVFDAADALGLSVPEYEAVLTDVQSLDPPGIGARNLRECLKIQADRTVDGPDLARRILDEEAWPLFVKGDISRLAHLCGARRSDIGEAVRWIRETLQPYPAEGYHAPWERLAPRKKPLEKPDVVIQRSEDDELWVECTGVTSSRLGIDPWYDRLYAGIRRARGHSLHADERHIVDFVDRARLIAYSVDLRHQTLLRLTQCVVESQRELILHGPLHAQPLTQKQLAEKLGLHESTICRAIQGKLVQLPGGETVTFDRFFDAALPIRALMEEIVGHEDRKCPLKDAEIAEELERRGVKIARRTVAKYRDQLHILPCELRRVRD